jgi:hypothetical protein
MSPRSSFLTVVKLEWGSTVVVSRHSLIPPTIHSSFHSSLSCDMAENLDSRLCSLATPTNRLTKWEARHQTSWSLKGLGIGSSSQPSHIVIYHTSTTVGIVVTNDDINNVIFVKDEAA